MFNKTSENLIRCKLRASTDAFPGLKKIESRPQLRDKGFYLGISMWILFGAPFCQGGMCHNAHT